MGVEGGGGHVTEGWEGPVDVLGIELHQKGVEG